MMRQSPYGYPVIQGEKKGDNLRAVGMVRPPTTPLMTTSWSTSWCSSINLHLYVRSATRRRPTLPRMHSLRKVSLCLPPLANCMRVPLCEGTTLLCRKPYLDYQSHTTNSAPMCTARGRRWVCQLQEAMSTATPFTVDSVKAHMFKRAIDADMSQTVALFALCEHAVCLLIITALRP